MARSVGSEKFSRLPGSVTKIALKLSTTLPNVSKWASGRQKPLQGMREQIKAAWPDEAPEPDEWDQSLEPDEQEREPAPELELIRATPQAVETEADEWLRTLRQARAEAALKTDVEERLRLLDVGSRTLLTLGKMTGAGLNLTEARILASPQWRAIESMIIVALEPWPEAMRAVAETLKKLAGTSQADQTGRTE